ncbi:NAD(P)-dependent oxidoreductase [Myxococcota bacterium]|nr:NAD(P)-dependent oxidoreductase [Myxococcota bacterium]
MRPVLVTGAGGVIGRAVVRALRREGSGVRTYDTAVHSADDILRHDRLVRAIRGCRGVIHLAAVSRVGEAERDPVRAWRVNRDGTIRVLHAAAEQRDRPWVLFASSREVYGEPLTLPVAETAPIFPVNTYGRTKASGERLVLGEARGMGLRTAVARLGNVYGAPWDHPDRVVPAWVAAALGARRITVHGPARSVDLVHVDDVVDGLLRMMHLLDDGDERVPPVNLVSGIETTLAGLSATVVRAVRRPVDCAYLEPPRHEVSRFVGDPRLARELLGWFPRVSLEEGIAALILDLSHPGPPSREARP